MDYFAFGTFPYYSLSAVAGNSFADEDSSVGDSSAVVEDSSSVAAVENSFVVEADTSVVDSVSVGNTRSVSHDWQIEVYYEA